LLALVLLWFPVLTFANSSVSFTHAGGTLSGANSALSLFGSTLSSVNGLEGTGLTVNTATEYFNGSTAQGSGDSRTQTVPEPGALSLVGIGLVGLAGVFHHKFKS
jgi:hypothetical protein